MWLGVVGGGWELLGGDGIRWGVAGCCGGLLGVADGGWGLRSVRRGGDWGGGAFEHELQCVRTNLERVAVIENGLAGGLAIDGDADGRLHVVDHPAGAFLADAGVEGCDVHVAAQWDVGVFRAAQEGLGGVDGPIFAFVSAENEANPSLAGEGLDDADQEADAKSRHAESNCAGDRADFGLLYPLHGNEGRPKDGRHDIKEEAAQRAAKDAADEAIVGALPTHAHRAFGKADDASHDRPSEESDTGDAVENIAEADSNGACGGSDHPSEKGALCHVLGRALEITRNDPQAKSDQCPQRESSEGLPGSVID